MQPARDEVVTVLGEGQLEGQAEVVVAEGIADVEPEVGAVGPPQLAAENARHHHDRGRVRIVSAGPEQLRIEAPPRSQGLGDYGPRGACQEAPKKGPEGADTPVPRLVHAHTSSPF